eukprot:15016613-Ditylum_brightwellii.AAC.1
MIRAPKHGKYSIEMYGHQGKWTVRMDDGLSKYTLYLQGMQQKKPSSQTLWSVQVPFRGIG